MRSAEKVPLLTTSEHIVHSHPTCREYLIIPAMLMYSIGLGTFFYVQSEWIQHFEKSRIINNDNYTSSKECGIVNTSDPNHKLYERVESETAQWQMLFGIAWYIPSILATSVLPAYSDCFGRRFILIVGCSGTMVKVIVTTLTVYFHWHPLYVVIASIAEGCTGSYFSVTSGCYAYLADLTKSGTQRTVGLTILDGLLMICMTLSGLASGYFVRYFGYFVPIATCCGLIASSYLMIVFLVPETYSKGMRSEARSPCFVLKRTFGFYTSNTFKSLRSAYVLLLLAYILENMTNGHRAALEILYQLGRPFCWSPEKIGIFSALRHVTQGLTGMFLVKPLQYCLSDINIAILSMIFGSGSFVLEGLATTDLMLYMVPVLSSLSFLSESMIKSLMSTMTPPDKQGSLFSGIVMAQVTCLVAANFIFNTIYADTVSILSGFIFLLQAGICLLTITVLLAFSYRKRNVLGEETEASINY